MIVWGRNRTARALPADCVPFQTIRKDSFAIKKPLGWPRDWQGWQVGRLDKNKIDEELKKLESNHD